MKLYHSIHKELGFVLAHLTDMQKFAQVHPVITKIDPIADRRYQVHETLHLGFLPFSFTYPVSVESQESPPVIRMKATVFSVTTIDITFVLKQSTTHGTLVEEDIEFTSLLPIKCVLEKVFRKQHPILFKNIENKPIV